MTFKLEDVEIETETETQEIVNEYDFKKKILKGDIIMMCPPVCYSHYPCPRHPPCPKHCHCEDVCDCYDEYD